VIVHSTAAAALKVRSRCGVVDAPATVSLPSLKIVVVADPPAQKVLLTEKSVEDAFVKVFKFVKTFVSARPAFALKVDQSVVERKPRFDADAVGALKVIVSPDPVIVKSVPVVDVANVVVGPSDVCPVGPIALIAAVDAGGFDIRAIATPTKAVRTTAAAKPAIYANASRRVEFIGYL